MINKTNPICVFPHLIETTELPETQQLNIAALLLRNIIPWSASCVPTVSQPRHDDGWQRKSLEKDDGLRWPTAAEFSAPSVDVLLVVWNEAQYSTEMSKLIYSRRT